MDVDPFFSMPTENWQQVGSYFEPFPVPAHAPNAGTLVALPCINDEWLALLLGSADQLRNPSTWDPGITPDQRAEVIGQADLLRSMLSRKGACVSPVVAVAIDCTNGLQYQTADGIWHVGTSMADICTCTNACLVPVTPPLPSPTPSFNQRACNIAGFLAAECIQKAIKILVTITQTASEQITFVTTMLQDLCFGYPIAADLIGAGNLLFQDYLGGLVSDFNTASTDPTLWSEVTCAIYNAIFADTYVDGTNLPALRTNICGVSYSVPYVIGAICTFVNAIPLFVWQAWQHVGALDDVDCSACGGGPWCWQSDLTASSSIFNAFISTCGNKGLWTAGVGWHSVPLACLGYDVVNCFAGPTSSPFICNHIEVVCGTNEINTTSSRPRTISLSMDNITYTAVITLPDTAFGTGVTFTADFPPVTAKYVGFELQCNTASGSEFIDITHILLRGPNNGTISTSNCTP